MATRVERKVKWELALKQVQRLLSDLESERKSAGSVWSSLNDLERDLLLRLELHKPPLDVRVEGKMPQRPQKGFGHQSQIIPLLPQQEVSIVHRAAASRVVGRTISEWSSCCGTYGMGGPGFVGFKMAQCGAYPDEWLILTLWGADEWLQVDGRWLAAPQGDVSRLHSIMSYLNGKEYTPGPDRGYYQQLPLTSGDWDEFTPLIVGEQIKSFASYKMTSRLVAGEVDIRIVADPHRRPLTGGSRELRALYPGDDLRDAWIIASAAWVEIAG